MSNVIIRKQESSEYRNTIKWLNNKIIQRNFGITREIKLEEHIDWLQKNSNIEILSILYNNLHVGNIVLDFNECHKFVFFQIYIGDTNSQGKKIGSEAMKITLNYVFKEKQMHRIHLKVFEDNMRAIALYEKLGFIKEGIERESHRLEGGYRNQLLYSMLSREWKGES